MACWTGDFGKGQETGSGVWSDPGANPCILYGPQAAAGVTSNGVPIPNFKLGMVVSGDLGTEFVYCKLVLSGTTDLLPGQVYQIDKDYNATLLVNASSVLNEEVMVLSVWGPATPAGTYYGWFGRAGHLSVQAAAGSVATGFGETTATAGQLKFPASATATFKSVSPASAYQASSGITFTGNTANGSPTITGIASINDLQVGQAVTGAGLPANAIIAALRRTGTAWAADIGTNTAGSYATLQNATANGTGVTFTVTSHVTCNFDWPTLNKQN